MSKYVKYISSEHFGAPVMKGDRWGYCVEMLRTCLVTGFNQRTDLNSITITSGNRVNVSFTTAHNYVVNQTIKLTDIPNADFNKEYLVYAVDGSNLTLQPYEDMSAFIGISLSGLTAKAIVAPLGMIEKFTDPNGRSVFTTDEDEAYFYIDDRPPPTITTWKQAGTNNTCLICPLVFMTDKMSDIDTVTGSCIVPYDSANPTYYKNIEYQFLSGANSKNGRGLWNFLSFGILLNSASGPYQNTPAFQNTVMKWELIGNGRMFYFIPQLHEGSSTVTKRFIFGWGKCHTNMINKTKPYLLFANPVSTVPSTTIGYGCFSYVRCGTKQASLLPTNVTSSSSTTTFINTDLGYSFCGILNINGKPSNVIFTPYAPKTLGTSIVISGNSNGDYPDLYTKKYNISKTKMVVGSSHYGNLSGIMWTYNTNSMYQISGTIVNHKFNNKTKRLYNFVENGCNSNNLDTSTNTAALFTYNISFDYEDWNNYE